VPKAEAGSDGRARGRVLQGACVGRQARVGGQVGLHFCIERSRADQTLTVLSEMTLAAWCQQSTSVRALSVGAFFLTCAPPHHSVPALGLLLVQQRSIPQRQARADDSNGLSIDRIAGQSASDG